MLSTIIDLYKYVDMTVCACYPYYVYNEEPRKLKLNPSLTKSREPPLISRYSSMVDVYQALIANVNNHRSFWQHSLTAIIRDDTRSLYNIQLIIISSINYHYYK
jgi:hypothetical protein